MVKQKVDEIIIEYGLENLLKELIEIVKPKNNEDYLQKLHSNLTRTLVDYNNRYGKEIYCVFEQYFDGSNLIGVFTSENLAKEALDKFPKKKNFNYFIEDMELNRMYE